MKRFWTEAAPLSLDDGRWGVGLDGRPVRTPEKQPLAVPSPELAALIAAEWAGQGEEVVTATMPVTRLVNVALDRTPVTRPAMVDQVVSYATSDLLCYRVETPRRLALTQQALWDPPLEWLADAFGARLATTTTLDPLPHDPAALATLRAATEACDDLRLTMLAHGTGMMGSAVLAFALLHGAATAETALAAVRVDETFQQETWGVDEEAEKAAAALAAEIHALEAAIRALG